MTVEEAAREIKRLSLAFGYDDTAWCQDDSHGDTGVRKLHCEACIAGLIRSAVTDNSPPEPRSCAGCKYLIFAGVNPGCYLFVRDRDSDSVEILPGCWKSG